jgi:amino acid transporter
MLNIIGFVILIVVTIFAYKTAKDYERNAIVWALVTFAVGFSLQIVVPIVIVMVMVIYMIANGSTPEQLQEDIPDVTISMIFLVISIVACVFIVSRLARVPDEKPFVAPPAPPTDFNQNT